MNIPYLKDPGLEKFVKITLRIHKRHFWSYADTIQLRERGLLEDFKQHIYSYYFQYKPESIKECSKIGNKCLYRFYTDYKIFKKLNKTTLLDPEGGDIEEIIMQHY